MGENERVNPEELGKKDRRYIWHPFTQMKDWEKEPPLIIEEGRGASIRDTEGRWYIDGVSSLWVNIHGHRAEKIDDAIKKQIDRISHSTLLGLSNVPAIELAEKLVRLVNGEESGVWSDRWEESGTGSSACSSPLTKVFYSDNGSTAVEVALKMAFQYWLHRGVKGKNSFLSLDKAYHGDTLGAVSVGGVDIFHETFRPLLFKTFKAPSPYCYRCGMDVECRKGLSNRVLSTLKGLSKENIPSPLRGEGEGGGVDFPCLQKMEDILAEHHNEIAAVILEPLVQAAGGMIVSPPGYLKGVRELCSRYRVLMIADEVATGFGRTGKMFACEHEGVVPDILCLSKGITGGYLPLAVTLASDEIYNAFLGEFSELKTFFHGHSYTGNPLGCAAALACLGIFEKEGTIEAVQPKIVFLEDWLRQISAMPHVGDARNKGLMAGVELVKDKTTKEPYPWEEKMGWRVACRARDKGVLIRPLGNVVVIMPPLAIDMGDLGRLLAVIREAIADIG